jgi:hypothetical protein
MVLISVHGAGGSGKSTFLLKIKQYQKNNIKNIVFIESPSDLSSANSIMDKRPILFKFFEPKFSIKTNMLKTWSIRIILFIIYIISLTKIENILIQKILCLLFLLSFIIPYSIWLFQSLFLQYVWDYEKLQHISVMNKIEELNKIELLEKKNWIWEDRNCIDVYSYSTLQKAIINIPDFQNILLEHTHFLSCGIFMDRPISLICKHHLKRAQESTNIFGYLISKLLATFPSLFIPTIDAVDTVKEWYLKHNIPFIKISEWIRDNKDNINEYDLITEEITWNEHNLTLLFSSLELLFKKNR